MFGHSNEGHIPAVSGIVMIIVAILIDGIQFFLTLGLIGIILNPLISIAAMVIFMIWLSHYGVSMTSTRFTIRFLLTIFGEVALGALPIWTFTTIIIVSESKMKETLGQPLLREQNNWL